MKQRITYIRDPSDGSFDPKKLAPKAGRMTVPGLQAAKEHHITLDFAELPRELVEILQQSHELHLRWVTSESYDAASPYNARLSPGLHVFWTPEERAEPAKLCGLLKDAFAEDIQCEDDDSFSSPPILSPRFTSSASHQYHTLVTSTARLQDWISRTVCTTNACKVNLSTIHTAAYLDLNYDAISRTATIASYHAHAPTSKGWTDTLTADAESRLEVGILNLEPTNEANDPSDIKLGGHLTVLSDAATESTKPSATLFSFAARHHAAPATYASTTFDAPTGLHPTLRIHLHGKLAPPRADTPCALHAYLTLPRAFFLDRHTLSDPLLRLSHNLSALRALSGATDLEAPAYALKTWGSAALLELTSPPDSSGAHSASVPLHMRYLAPAAGGYAVARAPAPALFWACRAEEGARFASSPFDRVQTGYDALFGSRTAFYHVAPAGVGVREVRVPVLDVAGGWAGLVGGVTGAVVLGGFFWLVWCLVRPVGRAGEGGEKEKSG